MIRNPIFLMLLLLACQQAPESTDDSVTPETISLLGNPLYPKFYSEEVQQQRLEEWQKAADRYVQDSTDLEHIIWYGRRTAYLQKYREAIRIYSQGLKQYPQSARLLRHRGHRYISLRDFDKAIGDFEKAASLMEGKPMHTEADGLPNRFNVPLGNTHFNIYYHWGLAHYLKGNFDQAADIYEQCLKYCNNDDLMTATLDWLYMAYRRQQDTLKAAALLERVHPEMKIIENHSYFRRLMMYKGQENPDSLLQVNDEADEDAKFLTLATQGYGVANWYHYHGQEEQALEILNAVIATDSWAAFGYIAAEADLARLAKSP